MNIFKNIAVLIMVILPLGYLAMIWNTVPDIVPTHIGTNGPDAWGNKSSLWSPTGVLAAASLFAYFLLTFLKSIDPKRANKPNAPVFAKMGLGIAVFLTALNFVLIKMMAQNAQWDKMMFVLMGGLFVFFVNIMPAVKPNYFAGIRLPWTLASDYNWKMTHQLAGKVWFAGGLVFMVVVLIMPVSMIPFTLPVFIFVIIIIPVVYSYRLFRKEQRTNSQE